MASIRDVARMAGVSTALVSRYLNNRVGVSPASRERIAEAVKVLGYRRNEIARSLVQQKTGAIGVITDTLCIAFNFELIRGLETGGQETGYKIIFCNCMNDVNIKRDYIDYFSHSRVDGLVLYGSLYTDNQIVAELSDSSFPFVMIENNVPGIAADKVLVDNRGGIRQMVFHLYEKGYRHIQMICWQLNTFAGHERLEGFKAGMLECGLHFDENIIHRANTVELTKIVINKMISSNSLPEALVFGADELAFSAIEIFEEKGIRVPEDVAVTGYDNDYYLSRDRLMPKLTTMEQPLFEMGNSAVKMLVERINDPSSPVKSLIFDAKLIKGVTD